MTPRRTATCSEVRVSQRRAGVRRRDHQPVRHRGVRLGRHGALHPGLVEVESSHPESRAPLRVLQLDDQGAVAPGRTVRAGHHLPRDQGRADLEGLRAPVRRGVRPVRRRPYSAEVRREQVHAADGRKLRQTVQPGRAVSPRTSGTGSTWIWCRALRRGPGIARPTDRDGIVQNNEIGPSNNVNFGKASGRRAVDDIQREYNGEYSAGVQHQISNNLSVTAGWYRRQYYRLIAEDNTAVAPSDYIPFQVTNPYNTAETFTMYNLNRSKQGLVEHPGVQLRHEHAYLQRHRVQLQQPAPERVGRVRRLDGPAQRRGHLRPGEPERVRSQRPLFRHQLPARRPVLRRAEHGHPVPPRLQVRRHAAAEVGPRVQRHVRELRRQRNPGRLERAGVGVPGRRSARQ